MAERLVIVDGPEALARLRAAHRVTHVASPRLVVVEGDDAPELPGVRDADRAEELDEQERLFADAFALRGQGGGERAGDRRDWDAPGFEAP